MVLVTAADEGVHLMFLSKPLGMDSRPDCKPLFPIFILEPLGSLNIIIETILARDPKMCVCLKD